MKIVIAGGGIGGLSAALCCLHFGHEITLLEKASVIKEVGAGIQISPNAMKVFEALGLENEIAEKAFSPERIEARMGISGRMVFTIPLAAKAKQRWGSQYFHIHRADLIGILDLAAKKQSRASLRLGAELARYSQDESGVTVHLTDGSQVSGDILIGADGIHSQVRAQMSGEERAEFTGNVAWRAVVPVSELGDFIPPPTACVWMGKGRHCVTYRLRGGELANLVAVTERDDWTKESWTEEGRREEALADFQGWHPVITTILGKADKLYRWALFDRPPLEKWVEGRAALLGDAAHPMLPFQAQGAAMAIEDSWVLARALATNTHHFGEALDQYGGQRQARTAKMQRASRANAKTFHKRTLLSQFGTYGPMWLGAKLMPEAVHRRQDWIYGFDVTAE